MSNNKYALEGQQKVREFFAKRPRTTYEDEDVIFAPCAKDALSTVCYLERGRVIQYATNKKDEKTILNIFKEGAFFPINHALGQTDVKHFYAADGPVMVRHASSSEVVSFVETNSVVLLDLMTRVSIGMEGLYERFKLALSGNLEARIMNELYLFAERFGYRDEGDGYMAISTPLTMKRLSELVGASREATSRVVKRLQEDGRLQRTGKNYKIARP